MILSQMFGKFIYTGQKCDKEREMLFTNTYLKMFGQQLFNYILCIKHTEVSGVYYFVKIYLK